MGNPSPDGMRSRRTPNLASRALETGLFAMFAAAAAPAQQTPAALDNTDRLEEVFVTATRREAPISKVPISISTFDEANLEARGVKTFQDLIRLTPGLNMFEDPNTGMNRVSIRGIYSSAGHSTTGLYIDDTPIQAVRLGDAGGNTFPGLFDVERVEILRGPQGTLFGAGSEGGTVRFITTPPDVHQASMHVLGEISTLDHGSPGYEAGFAAGGPLISDRLGYRISAYVRRDGGWIDMVDGTYQIVDPTGASYRDSVNFTRTSTLATDVNWTRTESLRAALRYEPTAALTFTPAVFYSERHVNDDAGNQFELSTSDTSAHNFASQGYRAGAAGTVYMVTATNAAGVVQEQPLILNGINAPNNGSDDDRFTLWSLGIDWRPGKLQLVSSTSYFDRTHSQWIDSTRSYTTLVPDFFVAPDRVTSTGMYAPMGWKAMGLFDNSQSNFVEELRLQSNDPAGRLTWVSGIFYSRLHQTAYEAGSTNFLMGSPWIGFLPTAAGQGLYAVTGGPPFYGNCGVPGPCTAAQNFFGDSIPPDGVSFNGSWDQTDEQLAGFGQADFQLSTKWKLTLGLRVAHNSVDYSASNFGAENNANAPLGGDPADFGCPAVPGPCAFGSGPLAPSYLAASSHASETATTPKYGLAYQIDDDRMVYATAAKGFRPGGANLRAPLICNSALNDYGYVDANGNSLQPLNYDPDSVWSYEIGSKSRLLGGRLALDASIYEIKWSNMQLTVLLNGCFRFVDNLGSATSKGFDLGFQFKATDRLGFEGAVGYNRSTFDKDATAPNGTTVLYHSGSSIPYAGPPWMVSLSGDYAVPLSGGYRGYGRVDYTYSSEWRRFGVTDPGTGSYDPRRKPVPAYSVVNVRFGAQFGGFDWSFFVRNLTNAAPDLFLYSYPDLESQNWYDVTLRPRTYGLAMSWRK